MVKVCGLVQTTMDAPETEKAVDLSNWVAPFWLTSYEPCGVDGVGGIKQRKYPREHYGVLFVE